MQIIGGDTRHAVSYPLKKHICCGKYDFFSHLLYSIDSPYIKMLITYFHFIFVFAKFFRVTFFYLKSGEKKEKKKHFWIPHFFSGIFTNCYSQQIAPQKVKREKMNLVKNYNFFSLSLNVVFQKCQARRPYFKILSQTNSFLADDCFYCPGRQRLENN